MSYQPPQQYPPPMPIKRRRPLWQLGCGVLLVLAVCAGIASVVVPPKSPAAIPAASIPPTATGASRLVSVPTATAIAALVPPTAIAPATVDLLASLYATATAQAKLPPDARYAPANCTAGVRFGALCTDGTFSDNTGKGACSGHKGVQQWLVCPSP